MPSQKPHPPDSGSSDAKENKRSPEGKPPLAAPAAPIAKAECGKANNNKTNWTEIFAFVAAIGGLLAAFAASYQGWVARDTEITGNRAYVTATAFQLINYGKKVDGHLQWTLRPIIENTGNTSPRSLKAVETVSGGIGPMWNFDSIAKGKFSPLVIPPHSQVLGSAFGFSVALPRMMLPAVAAGIIKYRDIYDARHLTEYCFDFFSFEPIDFDNYPAGQAVRVAGDVSNPRCSKHNCEDEDCGPDWKERAKE